TSAMDAVALRDHAEQILIAIAEDIETPQSGAQQEAKGMGRAPARDPALPEAPSQSHGSLRAADGFSLEQMVSEYRALRSSVLRLWAAQETAGPRPWPTLAAYEQQVRFNEAIDAALADSMASFAAALGQMQEARTRRRMEALGTLAAGLGHDMGNVLFPMRVCLEGLSGQTCSPEAAPLIDALARAIEHLSGLTRGLRALALDPEGAAAAAEAVTLREWWDAAVSPFTWTLPRGVRLHVSGLNPDDPPLPPVAVPAHVLMQAVFNIVQNAAQAHAEKAAKENAAPAGNIWVEARARVPGSAEPTAARAVVSLRVRDDGPGMDEATVRRCTDAFFTTRGPSAGSGLGLHVVRSALNRYGAALRVESAVGQGTTFEILLPAAPAPRPQSALPTRTTPRQTP
ncbi:MAG: sensor histidine kinase, partial [Phycisphaerales bacterium]|nr:sensor histidine kinase [Phycisphaerales bacterium]